MGYPNITQDIQELERKKVNLSDLINLIYPIGSIYMSANNVSPATFLGGTWEQIKDKFLLCAGSSYSAGSTGGEASHTLTVAETPAHTHTRGTMEITGSIIGGNYALFGCSTTTESGALYTSGGGYTSAGTSQGGNYKNNLHFQASRNWTGATSSVGSGTAHNNMPPYLTVYCWKRTA
jgi:hypothetical protein